MAPAVEIQFGENLLQKLMVFLTTSIDPIEVTGMPKSVVYRTEV